MMYIGISLYPLYDINYNMKSALSVNTFFYDTAADDNITVI
jgi:hypothetical protein